MERQADPAPGQEEELGIMTPSTFSFCSLPFALLKGPAALPSSSGIKLLLGSGLYQENEQKATFKS